jgi:hypothetical protein
MCIGGFTRGREHANQSVKILDGTLLNGFDIAMPFTPDFSKCLQGSMVLIVPQHGWGWRKMMSTGAIDLEDIPQHDILVRVESFVTHENELFGFYGVATDPALIDDESVVLCLLHTCERVGLDTCPPVSIHCSAEKVPVEAAALAPCGLKPVWDGMTGLLGWGQLIIDRPEIIPG